MQAETEPIISEEDIKEKRVHDDHIWGVIKQRHIIPIAHNDVIRSFLFILDKSILDSISPISENKSRQLS